MTLRELTEAWFECRLISGVDVDGQQYHGMPLVLDKSHGEVVAYMKTYDGNGNRMMRYRLIDTMRFDKVRHEFEVDLEPLT